jgi:hypothetical protein
MGPNTRLSFRAWLKGSSELRVQIYSLSNGYHRHLLLKDLPQGAWQNLTVDMTRCRKPDGSGGPLAAGERIDDIQFYADPDAELIIDDVVLYDAADAAEWQPFPKSLLFTGWFDSGKQGEHWPGDFEIVEKGKPETGKAARSVPKGDAAWLRVHLRGERTAGGSTNLRFSYRLEGATSLRVGLVNRTAKTTHEIELKGLSTEGWATTTLRFADATGKLKAGDKVDEIHFFVPAGGTLLVDDLLLYEPGD